MEEKKYNGQVRKVKRKKLPAKRMASKKQSKLDAAIKLAGLLLSALRAYKEAKPHINNIRKKKKK